jgi:hypothetical protein
MDIPTGCVEANVIDRWTTQVECLVGADPCRRQIGRCHPVMWLVLRMITPATCPRPELWVVGYNGTERNTMVGDSRLYRAQEKSEVVDNVTSVAGSSRPAPVGDSVKMGRA